MSEHTKKRVTQRKKQATWGKAKNISAPGKSNTYKLMGGAAAFGAAVGGPAAIAGALGGATAIAGTSYFGAKQQAKKISKSGVGGTDNMKKINKFRAKTPSQAYTKAKKKK